MTAKPESAKFTTFIALLQLTKSNNDHEALSAIRAANRLLSQFGDDWDALLRGRVTVIADPFTATPEPKVATPARTAPAQPPRPAPQAPPQPQQSRHHYYCVGAGCTNNVFRQGQTCSVCQAKAARTPPKPKKWVKPTGRKPTLNDLKF